MDKLISLTERYSDGDEIRITVETNLIVPHIPDSNLGTRRPRPRPRPCAPISIGLTIYIYPSTLQSPSTPHPHLHAPSCCPMSGPLPTHSPRPPPFLPDLFLRHFHLPPPLLLLRVPADAFIAGLEKELPEWKLRPATISKGTVTCTGNQFCGQAKINTKGSAQDFAGVFGEG